MQLFLGVIVVWILRKGFRKTVKFDRERKGTSWQGERSWLCFCFYELGGDLGGENLLEEFLERERVLVMM